jgi:methionyl aminopeptidase
MCGFAAWEICMSIESPSDLAGLERAGIVTRRVIEAMKAAVRPGISTLELDNIGGDVMRRHGARSAPHLVYAFPGNNCISVNDEVVHGVPGPRTLQPSDLVKLDVTVELDGYMADACETVAVAPIRAQQKDLIGCAQSAFHAGLQRVRPGARAFEIGESIHREVTRCGYSVVRDLTGHGIGRTIHEPPRIPNHRDPNCDAVLTEGLVFTIEPIVSVGSPRTFLKHDGWTLRTRDHSLSAHYEHTVVVTAQGARLLTA